MSGNLFEEFVNSLGVEEEKPFSGYGLKDIQVEIWDGGIDGEWAPTVEIDPEYFERIREEVFKSFDPTWMRVCTGCGRLFASEDWRAEHCPDCGGGE